MLYHTNFRPPLLEEGAQFLVPVEVVTPFNDHVAREIKQYNQYLAQLPQCRAGNRLKIRVPSIFQSLFGWLLPQVFTGRMISVGTPSASYRTLWSGSGVALRRIRRTPFWSVGRTIVAIS